MSDKNNSSPLDFSYPGDDSGNSSNNSTQNQETEGDNTPPNKPDTPKSNINGQENSNQQQSTSPSETESKPSLNQSSNTSGIQDEINQNQQKSQTSPNVNPQSQEAKEPLQSASNINSEIPSQSTPQSTPSTAPQVNDNQQTSSQQDNTGSNTQSDDGKNKGSLQDLLGKLKKFKQNEMKEGQDSAQTAASSPASYSVSQANSSDNSQSDSTSVQNPSQSAQASQNLNESIEASEQSFSSSLNENSEDQTQTDNSVESTPQSPPPSQASEQTQNIEAKPNSSVQTPATQDLSSQQPPNQDNSTSESKIEDVNEQEGQEANEGESTQNSTASSGDRPNIFQLLDMVKEREASDLHISIDYPVMIRVDGELVEYNDIIIDEDYAEELILPLLDEAKKDRLEVNREVDLAYAHEDKARFRVNAYYQQKSLAAALRLIPTRIMTLEELNLPSIYHKLAKLNQGFVLVTGPTGSGKSTTLAAILQEINQNRACHILTVEDPIEYVYSPAKAKVAQRELGDDTHSWKIAMKSALRQDPDVVLVGEMRDYETISSAITLSETGHLVFATLHTNSAAQTVSRIIDVFPEHQQNQVRAQLSNILEAVIAQRLVPLENGGRTAASEIMLANPAVRNLIREGKTHQLDNTIRTSADIGMISMEHSLVKLVRDGAINMETAQKYAVKPEEIVRLLKN